MKGLRKAGFFLVITAVCLFEFVAQRHVFVFEELEIAFLGLQWMLAVCIAAWCGSFLFLTFSLKDLLLVGLLFSAIAAFFISLTANLPAADAITLLFLA